MARTEENPLYLTDTYEVQANRDRCLAMLYKQGGAVREKSTT